MAQESAKMKTLKDKLEEKKVLEAAVVEVEEKIEEIEGAKKVKIIKKKSA